MNKQDYKASMTLTRRAARAAIGLPTDSNATFPQLDALYADIARDTASEREEMIAADTLANRHFEKDYITNAPNASERLQAPPLPVGLKMPPNVCLAPTINLPAINV